MSKLNDHNSREIVRQELRGIAGMLDAMDHRQVDVVYLASLVRDYQGHQYTADHGWQLSRATILRIKAMLEGE